MGKVIQVSQPHAPGAAPAYTTYTYDARGRTLRMVKPDNSTTTYSYAGNTTTVLDAVGSASGANDKAGHWKMFTTDALGNLTQVTEADPAATPLPALPSFNLSGCDTATTGYHKTCYSYNALNKLTLVKMPRSEATQTRTFNYESNGVRLASATNPENGTVSYTYNSSDGTLATRTDAKGQVVQYSYDK